VLYKSRIFQPNFQTWSRVTDRARFTFRDYPEIFASLNSKKFIHKWRHNLVHRHRKDEYQCNGINFDVLKQSNLPRRRLTFRSLESVRARLLQYLSSNFLRSIYVCQANEQTICYQVSNSWHLNIKAIVSR